MKVVGTPSTCTRELVPATFMIESSIAMPMPPSRIPSSTVITSLNFEASAIIAGSSGAQLRTSQTLVGVPDSLRIVAALIALPSSLPTASMHTSADCDGSNATRACSPFANFGFINCACHAFRVANDNGTRIRQFNCIMEHLV